MLSGDLPTRCTGTKMKIEENKIVAKGKWKYGGITPCLVIIQEETTWPGSGDYEDPPEIAENREVRCFSVWYENPSNKGSFNAGGGYFLTLEEAIRETTKKLQGPVNWDTAAYDERTK